MTIRALAFDAVGTVLHPEPPAWDVYAAVARRYGSRLALAEIKPRFLAAFAEQERLDAEHGWQTDEEREVRRWRDIVTTVLDDVADAEGCFATLYDHFAHPSAWRCFPEVAEVLTTLRQRGFALALASNFDRRLRTVAAGLPALRPIELLVISSEVGWRKPAPPYFAALAAQLRLPSSEILLVGDDRGNDYDGARQAGMPTLLLDRRSRPGTRGEHGIGDLSELLISNDGRVLPA